MASLVSGIKEFYVTHIHPKPVSSTKENFVQREIKIDNVGEAIGLIIAIFVLLALQIILGKYIWNNFLVKVIPGVKPLHSHVQIIALFVLVRLFI